MVHRPLSAGLAALVLIACTAMEPGSTENKESGLAPGFDISYTAGTHDQGGTFMGGTEMRNLVAHQGKLYAGNGYWEDRPGWEGFQGAQVLVLDRPDGQWRVDGAFTERLPNGRARHLVIAALLSATFTHDGSGHVLAIPVPLLIAGTWDLSGWSQVFSRDDASGHWTAVTLPTPHVTAPNIQQVRSLGFHRDRVTGIESVFAGNDPHGIYSGNFDPSVPGNIRWSMAPELGLSAVKAGPFPGLTLERVTSFAECEDKLYAAVGQQIYGRTDGPAPRWELLYTNPQPGYSESGLRGLTCVENPSDSRHVLLAAVEGTRGRIVRIDPQSGTEQAELNVNSLLGKAWGTEVLYVISAYNSMARLASASESDGERLLIGVEAKFAKGAPLLQGHSSTSGFESGGWYLVRDRSAHYSLQKIGAHHPVTGLPLVSTRDILASPFGGRDEVYFAGYDANKVPAHNTAWIVSAHAGVSTQP
jgi:hypothetical protein